MQATAWWLALALLALGVLGLVLAAWRWLLALGEVGRAAFDAKRRHDAAQARARREAASGSPKRRHQPR